MAVVPVCILTVPADSYGFLFARHEGDVVVAVDDWEDLLTIVTLQIQTEEGGRYAALVAQCDPCGDGMARGCDCDVLLEKSLWQCSEGAVVSVVASPDVGVL